MDAILGHKPSMKPPVVVESATAAAAAAEIDNTEDEQQIAHEEDLLADSLGSSFSVNETTFSNLATSACSRDSLPVTSKRKAMKRTRTC